MNPNPAQSVEHGLARFERHVECVPAAGIGGFSKIFNFVERNAPLRRNVTIEEVGNVAAFFFSDLASAITGEITYVDAGFSTVAAGLSDE
mgnify:CR=1 FL=1